MATISDLLSSTSGVLKPAGQVIDPRKLDPLQRRLYERAQQEKAAQEAAAQQAASDKWNAEQNALADQAAAERASAMSTYGERLAEREAMTRSLMDSKLASTSKVPTGTVAKNLPLAGFTKPAISDSAKLQIGAMSAPALPIPGGEQGGRRQDFSGPAPDQSLAPNQARADMGLASLYGDTVQARIPDAVVQHIQSFGSPYSPESQAMVDALMARRSGGVDGRIFQGQQKAVAMPQVPMAELPALAQTSGVKGGG